MWAWTHRTEVIFIFKCTTSSGTEGGVQTGEMLVSTHLQEGRQLVRGKADEVQVALVAPKGEVRELQVNISYTCFAISGVWGEVAADAFQTLHLLLFLFCCNVFGLKVDQLHQCATNVHAKPWESWGPIIVKWLQYLVHFLNIFCE